MVEQALVSTTGRLEEELEVGFDVKALAMVLDAAESTQKDLNAAGDSEDEEKTDICEPE